MQIQLPTIQTTQQMIYRPTFLVYGPAKIGKTVGCASTAPSPFVINTDRGVESLKQFQDLNIPLMTIDDTRQLSLVIDWVIQNKANIKTVILDDFTECG